MTGRSFELTHLDDFDYSHLTDENHILRLQDAITKCHEWKSRATRYKLLLEAHKANQITMSQMVESPDYQHRGISMVIAGAVVVFVGP